MRKHEKWAYAIFISVALMLSNAVQARSIILDELQVQEGTDQSTIKVRFLERLVYQSHAPAKSSDVLQIHLNGVGLTDAVTFEDEFLSYKPSANVPLFKVELEWPTTTTSNIILRFNSKVKYTVSPSADSYSLVVTVYHEVKDKGPQNAPHLSTDKILPVVGFKNTPENQVLSDIMETARQAIANKDYDKAIRLYTKVIGADEPILSKKAFEYLGVAREKKGQLAHAISIYKRFLKKYKTGEDSDRVNQRLQSLVAGTVQAPGDLREAKRAPVSSEPRWSLFGSVGQTYNRGEFKTETTGTNTTQSSLRSDVDITTRRRSDFNDITARFSGGHTGDFLRDGSGDEKRITSAYVDFKEKTLRASARFGRQSRNRGGVLGRFDGVFADYEIVDDYTLNVVAGYPVDSSRNVFLDDNRYFYGFSMDINKIAKSWDLNVFAINQMNDSEVDRRAIGGELRFFEANKSFFTLIDYDIYYQSLNLFLATGQWRFPDKTLLNMSYDYRNSPLLSTENAIQGQLVSSIGQLLNIFSKNQVEDFAEDRTAVNKTFSFGLSKPISENYQISGDVRVSKLSSTKSSGGVIANPATDTEFDYTAQFTGFNILKQGDLALVTLNYAQLTNSDSSTITFNTRYPFTRAFRINPRFRFRHRKNHSDGSTVLSYRPSIQTTYRIKRYLQLEAEWGAEWANTDLNGGVDRTRDMFVFLGYRLDF